MIGEDFFLDLQEWATNPILNPAQAYLLMKSPEYLFYMVEEMKMEIPKPTN
jgi:hypothetical protein